MKYQEPNQPGSLITFRSEYGNFIGGEWVGPVDGQFFDAICPIYGKPYTRVPRSNAKDIELALDAAHRAFPAWSKTSVQERSQILLEMANRMERNAEKLAVAETWGNGKPIRESLLDDLPHSVDQIRYFGSVIRAEESGMSEIDALNVSYHLREPLGVVGQIIPWNFPLAMAIWKIAPALVTGNCVVLKPAEQTPVSILLYAEMIQDLLPKGVLNIVNGFGPEAGKPLASSSRIAKIAFTGETATGKLILQYASENIIPATVELGGKSPNIFMADVMDHEDEFLEKSLEGLAMFASNQGQVCTCPSRALIQESIYEKFLDRAVKRVRGIKVGHPLDTETMMGAQVSAEQMDRILSYMRVGQEEGAKVRTGGSRAKIPGLESGYYLEPTILEGHNKMRVFQEEIFGPVLSVTSFKTADEAVEIANDTPYGLGAGVWTRNVHDAFKLAKGIQAGRIWTNCYHTYPAHAAFGGYKKSGFGRETHKMMLQYYTQTKNILVSYDQKPTGLYPEG